MNKRYLRKKRVCKIANAIIFAMVFLLQIAFPYQVRAATGGTLVIENLEPGDSVEIYRIASYSETTHTYAWESAVSDWLINKSEGNAYKSLLPEKLDTMTPERAQEFCETLLIGLKNEKEGIANLRGYSFIVEEEKEQYLVDPITPGYYILLPKGKTRIYGLKWLRIEDENSVTVVYDENAGDFQIPLVEATVENLTEERMWGEGEEKNLFALDKDKLKVTANLMLPDYPDMYPIGKRILNITIVIPKGLAYTEDTFSFFSEEDLEYSFGQYDDTTIYVNNNEERLFFGTESGFFYEMNGNQLTTEGTAQEALAVYNEKYGTEYELPVEEEIVIADIAEEEDTETETKKPEEVSETESEESTPHSEDVSIIEDDGAMWVLERQEGMKVFVVSLDTKKIPKELTLNYELVKNATTNTSGFYDNLVALSYSTSPLNANLICSDVSIARVHSYGIRITLCQGSGETNTMTTEEQMHLAKRLTDAEFSLYRLSNVYDGEWTGEEEEISGTEVTSTIDGEDTGDAPLVQRIYNEEKGQTYEYSLYKTFSTNTKGQAFLGGIEPDEYLLIQSKYPIGYTLSEVSLLISKSDWTDGTVMEGNNLLDILWLDYKTVYLPGTGKRGIIAFVVIGTFISGVALLLLIDRYYPMGFVRQIRKKIKR